MGVSVWKYWVRSTSCLSCGIKEDDYEARAYIVHESCQSGMLLDVPFDDESRLGALEDSVLGRCR